MAHWKKLWVLVLIPLFLQESLRADEQTAAAASAVSASGANPGTIAPSGSADNFLFTGSFLYNVPIDVPPGIAGLQPELSLQYNSSSGNGWCGVGWDLSVGAISRSTKNGIPTYDDTKDTFVVTMKGQTQELVKIADGTYRAKIEGAFQKFVFSGNTWTVYDKSGTRFYFGQAQNSRLDYGSSNTPPTFLWALDKVKDRNNNTMTFSYHNSVPNPDNQIYVKEILYTGNDVATRPLDRKVVFSLATRPDVTSTWRPRFKQMNTRRLDKVETFVLEGTNWTLVKKYQLNYTVPANRIQPQLASVVMSGTNGTETITLPPTSFTYSAPNPSWLAQASNFPLQLPEYLTVSSRETGLPPRLGSYTTPPIVTRDNGVRFLELNGDGRLDMVIGITFLDGSGSHRRAYLNTPTGWQAAPQWAPPLDFMIGYNVAAARDNGMRVVDLNSDGLSDLVLSLNHAGTQHNYAWINTGSGWRDAGSQWLVPTNIMVVGAGEAWSMDQGVQFADINGDGRQDIVQSILVTSSNASVRKVWLNNGSGWTSSSGALSAMGISGADSWMLPGHLSVMYTNNSQTRGNGAMLVDINADGLIDFVQNYFNPYDGSQLNKVYLNKGPGWEDATAIWQLPVRLGYSTRDEGAELADINGDGLVDIVQSYKDSNPAVPDKKKVYLNTGNGWQDVSSIWTIPDYFTIKSHTEDFDKSINNGYSFVDLDSDGQPDLVRNDLFLNTNLIQRSVHLTQSCPLVMTSLRTPIGGTTSLIYGFTSSDLTRNHKIPFPLQTLGGMTQQDGRGNSISTTYSYSYGLFDAPSREFLGFGVVETKDAQNNFTRVRYHQKLDRVGNPVPSNALKGQMFATEKFNAAGQMLQTSENVLEYVLTPSGSVFPRVASVRTNDFQGSPVFQTRTDFFYDDAPAGPGFGNLVRTLYQGDISITGDERTEEVEYARNDTSYLLGFPKARRTKNASGQVVSESQFFYDGLTTLGSLSKGNVTEVKTWLDKPAVKWLSSKSEYNALGQVTAVVDVLGRRTETTYHASGFPISVKNALNQTVQSSYDLKTGNVLSDTDSNGQVTSYVYDALGRTTKVVGPLDTAAFPSVAYDYHPEVLGMPGHQNVETKRREKNGVAGELISKSFMDGLGRVVSNETEKAAGGWLSAETIYNNRGLVERTALPHSNTETPLYTQNFYDHLGRTIEARGPDGRSVLTTYQGPMVQVQDANGKIQKSLSDAFGRVLKRFEPSITNPTVYEYDGVGNLVKLTDSLGKITTFSYDSLGRKLSMSDPNAGTWNYKYDDAGNLIEQTDARGVKIAFEYDVLNRLKKKTMTADPSAVTGQTVGSVLATYTYDETVGRPTSKGQLTSISDPSGVAAFYHDKLGRVTRESRTIGALTYSTTYFYDALGRVTSVVSPNNKSFNYAYNAASQVDKITDEGAQVLASQPSYNSLGQPLSMEQGNGSRKTTYTYDPQRQLLSSLKTETGLGGSSGSTPPPPPPPPANTLLAWSMEATEPIAANFNPPSTDPAGTGTTTSPVFVAGKSGQALSFNGTRDVFSFPNSTSFSPNQFTMMMWINPSAYPSSGYATLMSKGKNFLLDSLGHGYRMSLTPEKDLAFEVGFAGAPTVFSEVSIPLNQWTHVAVTYNGNQMHIYINGRWNNADATWGDPGVNTFPVTLGASLGDNGRVASGTQFKGAIDEPRLYSRVFSEAEVLAAYQNPGAGGSTSGGTGGTPVASTVTIQNLSYAYDAVGNITGISDLLNAGRSQTFNYDDLYRVVRASGSYGLETYTYDSLGNFLTKNQKEYKYTDPAHPYAVTAIYSSTASGGSTPSTPPPSSSGDSLLAWHLESPEPIAANFNLPATHPTGAGTTTAPVFVAGKYGQALSFNGTRDVFTFPNSSTLSPNQFSMMLWVNPTAYPTSGFATLMTKAKNFQMDSLGNGFRMSLTPEKDLAFEVGFAGAPSVFSEVSIPLNKWTHVAVTYNGNQMHIYINGVWNNADATWGDPGVNTFPVTLGASLGDNGRVASGTQFKGSIDEPRLYNRVLSEAEVLSAYQNPGAGVGASTPPPSTPSTPTAEATFTYDANGNLKQKVQGATTTNYTFDAEGRLTKITVNGATQATFVYDAAGNRVKKVAGSNTSLYIGKLYEARPDGSQVVHLYHNGQLISDRVTASGQTKTYYYHSNHLGSVSLVTDPNGAKVQELRYTPFGEVHQEEGTLTGSNSPLRHTYTSQEKDAETGLMFYNARYYDAALGRFISADTIVPSLFDGQSLNRYSYVRNNPVMYDDPSGHKFSFKNLGWIFALPYAPSLAYNGMAGNINNSQDFQHYGAQAAAYNAAIGLAGVGIAAITPGTAVNGAAQAMFPGGWDAQAYAYFENANNVLASIGTNGWSILGWGTVGAGSVSIGYNLMQKGPSPDATPPLLLAGGGCNTGQCSDADGQYGSIWNPMNAYRASTQAGQESAEWYAGRYAETGGYAYGAGGLVASLWTPETAPITATTLLLGASSANMAAGMGPRIGIFSRGGLLNNNPYLRIGYNWNNVKKSEVFRISLGNKRSSIHKHLDLWRK